MSASQHPNPPKNLIDGAASALEHPDTFHVPDQYTINALKIGGFVKIGLALPTGETERFWVRLTAITRHGQNTLFTGAVENDLKLFPEYPFGAPISFRQNHVLGALE